MANNDLQDAKDQIEKLKNEYDALDEAAKKTNELLRKGLEAYVAQIEKSKKHLEEQNKMLERHISLTKDHNKKLELQAEKRDLFIKQQKRQLELALENGTATEEMVAEYEKLVKTQEKLNKFAERAPDFIKGMFSGKGGDAVSKLMGQIGGDIEKELVSNLKNAFNGAESLGAGLQKAAGPAAVLIIFTMSKAILELAVKLHDAEGAFMRTTGASREFAHSLSESYDETRAFGASLEETSKAMESLYTGFTDFTMQDKATREGLTQTATVLTRLGVSADDFSTSIQNMTKAMGYSTEGAGQQMLNMEKFAREIGVAPSKIAKDFASAGGTLAKFGDRGVEAFKRLEVASKITGMAFERILAITEKFDTFEGAATQAGKLNAALGGNFVNAMDLMMQTDPVGRMEQIRDAILSTGMSFDDMTYYQQNMYKEMLGLQDVGELALLLSGRTDLMADSAQQSAQSYEEAAERAKTMASFQEKMNIAFAKLIPIVTPLVDLLVLLGDVIMALGPMFEGFGEVFGVIFEGLGFILSGIGDALKEVFGADAIKIILKVVGAIAAGVAVFAGLAALLNPLGATIAGIVAGIAALAGVFGALRKSMTVDRNSPTLYEAIGDLGQESLPAMQEGIKGTTVEAKGLRQELQQSELPAMAENMAEAEPQTLRQRIFGGGEQSGGTQTVEKPVELVLNGDKLGKFIVKVVGENIKTISIAQ